MHANAVHLAAVELVWLVQRTFQSAAGRRFGMAEFTAENGFGQLQGRVDERGFRLLNERNASFIEGAGGGSEQTHRAVDLRFTVAFVLGLLGVDLVGAPGDVCGRQP